MTQTNPIAAEPAGAARFQTAGATALLTTPPAPASAPGAPKTFVDQLKEDAEGSMNALETRVTELETVVHRLASAADGTHPGISSWLEKVGSRIWKFL